MLINQGCKLPFDPPPIAIAMLAKAPLGTLAPAKKESFSWYALLGELAEAAPLSSASKNNIRPALSLPSKLKCR